MADIELQAGMVEIIFRLIPCAVRHERAQEYFSTNSASQAFSDITSPEFEAVSLRLTSTISDNYTVETLTLIGVIFCLYACFVVISSPPPQSA